MRWRRDSILFKVVLNIVRGLMTVVSFAIAHTVEYYFSRDPTD